MYKQIIQVLVGILFRSKPNIFLTNFSTYRRFLIFVYFKYKTMYEAVAIKYFEATIKSGDVVYDVGGGWGFYTKLFSNLVGPKGKVLSFEPSPFNQLFLQQAIASLKYENVIFIPKAVSATCTHLPFVIDFANPANSQVGFKSNSIEVETCRLDDFIHTSSSFTLVKIDVQGHEIEVLRGATELLAQPAIQLYVEFDNQDELKRASSLRVFNHLCNLGYSPFILDENSRLKYVLAYPDSKSYFDLVWV